ncbi:putative membrane protein [Propionispora sp. 2/2-37]|uniref:GlsB/YeaQ/YmgE family stress response membrane protein n=1 Tax=Propionispora sp. 2/2-37 TaxID=1677858 RepID=UPI0006BB5635|nr:GlsB/YeaQ/YmgE family stress response membrane protein [Propionispora sp. 2/2-37]CUH97828.1 putative membrane protein [Propionispora sp. 2/2-37]
MLWFLVIGVISGWLAGIISRGGGFGFWGNMITGVIGSFVGGFLFNLLGISAYGTIGSIISATFGAVVLLWGVRIFFHVAPAAHKKE